MRTKILSELEKLFEKLVAVTYYCSAAYFLLSATFEGYFWGFASGLVTAWILPLIFMFPCLAIVVFGSIMIISSALFGQDAPFDFAGLWAAIRAVWFLVSAINVWVATLWSDDAQTFAEVWDLQTADWIIFNN